MDTTNNIQTIKQFLKSKLPDYMIPSHFVILPRLPLTPNGKVDRKALPEPNEDSIIGRSGGSEIEFIEPRTSIEKYLVEIWKELLGLEKISINDNFFELGGHSLLATQLVSRLRS